MPGRAPIIAGKTVILLQLQDTIDSSLLGVRNKLKKFSASIGNIGLDLFRGGIVGTIPLVGILREFQTFEDKILFLSTKLEATDREFKGLTETIRLLGRTTSFTAQEVADGATILAQAGFNAAEVKSSLQALLDLGRGGQIELGQAGAILANTIRSFGLETKEAGNVASQFIVAARLGTLDVLDLKESIKEVLGTVRALNIDLPTTLALLTQLAERSLKGTKAGTSLNTALLQLASKQDVIRKSLKIPLPESIGGDTFIVFLEQLLEKLKQLPNLKKVAVLQSLFNIRGGRAITALDDIEKILSLQKAIRGAGDEARIAAKKMDSGFGGAIRFAVSAVRDLGIELGKLAAGPLTEFLRLVPTLSNSVREIVTLFPGFTLALLATPPAMLVVGAGLLTLSFGLSKLAGLIGVVSLAFTSIGGRIFSVFNAQLTTAVQLVGALTRSIKKIDSAAANQFLGVQDPAKVLLAERRVARARQQVRAADIAQNAVALKKAQRNLALSQGRLASAKTSSFTGRALATNIPIIAPIEAGFRALPKIAASSFARIGKIASTFSKGFLAFQRGGQSLTARLFSDSSGGTKSLNNLILNTKTLRQATLQAREQRIALGKAEASLVNEFKSSIDIQRKALATSKALERQALDSVDVLDRQTILKNQVSNIDLKLARVQASTIAPTKKELILRKQLIDISKQSVNLVSTEKELGLKTRLTTITKELADEQSKSIVSDNRLSALVNKNAKLERREKLKFLSQERKALLLKIAQEDQEKSNILTKKQSQIFDKRNEITLALQAERQRKTQKTLQVSTKLAARRTAIQNQIGTDAPDVENLINKAAIQKGLADQQKARRVELAAKIRNTREGVVAARVIEKKAFADRLKAGETLTARLARREEAAARLAARRPARISTGIDKTLVGGLNLAQKALFGFFRGAFTLIKKVDLVRVLFNISKVSFSIARGFLIAANSIRRFVFSLSGIGFIIEGLILFGPHITFIREAFQRLGKGISDAFKTIFGTFKDAAPAFSLFREGINSIVRGDGQIGLNQMAESLSLIGSILRSNLTIAWSQFVEAIAPAYDFLRKFIASTLELGGLFASLFGASFGTGFKGLADLFSSVFTGKSFTEALKEAFAAIDMRGIFQGLGLLVVGIGETMIGILQSMFNIVADTMLTIQRLLATILNPNVSVDNSSKTSVAQSFLRIGIRRIVERLTGSTDSISTAFNSITTNLKTAEASVKKTNTAFDGAIKTSTDALTRFNDALDKIFSASTEVASAERRHAAEEDKLGAINAANIADGIALTRLKAGRLLPGENVGNLFLQPNIKDNRTQLQKDAEAISNRIFKSERFLRESKDQIGISTFKSASIKERKDLLSSLKDDRRALALNKLEQRFGLQGLPQRGSIRDVVSATVGSIQTARFNKFKALGDNPQKQTNDLLGTISDQLGGSEAGGSYLKEIAGKVGPGVFTQ